MKKLSFLSLLAAILAVAVPISGQTITFSDGVTQTTANGSTAGTWEGPGVDLTHDTADSILFSNLVVQDPGFEPFAFSSAMQVDTRNTGMTTYWSLANQYANFIPNNLYGATYTQFRGGNRYTGTITGNNGTSNTAVTASMSGSTVGGFNIVTASQPGFANGTYQFYIHGGGGSGATGTFTITGASLSASGYTGGSITSTAVTAAGTGFSSYSFSGTTTSGSGVVTSVSSFTGLKVGQQISSANVSGLITDVESGSGTVTVSNNATANGSVSITATSIPTVTMMPGFAVTATSASGGFAVGDYVIVRQIQMNTAQAAWPYLGWFTSGAVVGETTDLPNDSTLSDVPAGTANTQAIDLTGASSITTYSDQGNGYGGQNHRNVVGPMLIDATVEAIGSSTPITWRLQRTGTGGFNCSGTLTATTSWSVVTGGSSCSPNETSTAPIGKISISFAITSGEVRIDNVAVYDTSRSTNGTAFDDAVVNNLIGFNGGIRILDNQLTMPMAQVLQPDIRGEMPYGFSEGCAGQPLYQCANLPVISLPMALALRNKLHKGLWYNIPATSGIVDSTDGAVLAEYMGGGGGTTGGAIRVAQGQTATYASQLAADNAVVHFEHGNEPWNTAGAGDKLLMVPALGTNEYTPYGYAVQAMYAPFKADAAYSAVTEDLVMGAQTCGGCGIYAMDSLASSSTGIALAADSISQTFYWGFQQTSGGYDTATPISTQMQSAFAEAYNDMYLAAGSQYIMSQTSGYPMKFEFYEGNSYTGVATGTGIPTQAELNGYQNGLGAGLVNALQSLGGCFSAGYCGFQGLFSYENYSQTTNNGSGNVNNYLWGGWLGSGAQLYNTIRPTALTLQALNGAVPFGATPIRSVPSSIPTWAFTAVNTVPSISSVPTAYGYGFKKGSQRTYAVLCMNPSGATCPITLAGVALSGPVTQTVITSPNLTDNNETSSIVAPATSSVTMPTTYTAPAFSMTLFSGIVASTPTTSGCVGGMTVNGGVTFNGGMKLCTP